MTLLSPRLYWTAFKVSLSDSGKLLPHTDSATIKLSLEIILESHGGKQQ